MGRVEKRKAEFLKVILLGFNDMSDLVCEFLNFHVFDDGTVTLVF